jgi:hypothetical protein
VKVSEAIRTVGKYGVEKIMLDKLTYGVYI